MSHIVNKTKSLFAAESVAGNSKKVFSMRGGIKGAAIQVVITADCLSVSTVLDECVSLACNSYTDVAHGFETGLKGTFAAVIGCASTTPAACVAICACRITITEACHGYTKGERGQFTTSCADLPAGICLATNYFVTNVVACTYDISSTRALAIACCADVAVTDAGTGCHTFTPNGAIPTGSTACSFIIKIDACTYKLATSKVNAEAGTVDAITALNAPASLTFTAAAADCTSGTVTVRYSIDDVTYTVDAGAGLLDTPGVILAAGLTVVDNQDGLHYNSFEVEVDVTDSQWVVNIDANGKE